MPGKSEREGVKVSPDRERLVAKDLGTAPGLLATGCLIPLWKPRAATAGIQGASESQINHNLAKRQSYGLSHNMSALEKGDPVRSIARQKLGYFPLSSTEAERIRRFLMFSVEERSVLDPCAGTGAALARITSDARVERFAVELDAYRADEAAKAVEQVRRSSLCTTSIPQKKLSTMQSPPGVQVGQASSSSNWTSFSSPWERAWDGHEVIDLGVGCPAMSGRPTSFGSSTTDFHNRVTAGITPCETRRMTPKSQV